MSSALCSLYDRAEGAVAFIDESYHAPKSGPGRTFYITCAVLVPKESLESLRGLILQVVGSNYWHTSEAARSASGRSSILEFASILNSNIQAFCWVYEPIESSDREGESARAKTLRFGIMNLIQGHLDPGGLVIYESRRDGYQLNADRRVIAEMRSNSMLDRDFMVHGDSPSNEILLWAPDVVAWSYRQAFLGRSFEYFEALKDVTKIVDLNSKSRLP